jgi:hypothetical protein
MEFLFNGARGSVVGWGSMLQAERKVAGSSPNEVDFQLHYGPGVYSAYNRNEYQESSWG